MMRVIEEVGGGMRNGKKLKAVIPGGSSCPVLKADECDIPMDYDSLAKAKSMLGSGGMVILDEDTDIVPWLCASCGFMRTKAAAGAFRAARVRPGSRRSLRGFVDGMGDENDIVMIGELSKNMLGRTFCPLGDAAAMPTIAIIEKFRNEFEEYSRTVPRPKTRVSVLALAN